MKRFVLLAMSAAVLVLVTQSHAPPRDPAVPSEAPVMLPALGGASTETGYIPPEMDLSHLDGSAAFPAMARQALPASWDWRTEGGVTPVKNQGSCGSCYSFAAIADSESQTLMDDVITYDFSENNAKECNWRELNNVSGWGSCDGGNYQMLVTLFSTKGVVLETDDPYEASDVGCNSCVPYHRTLRDWRIISGNAIPTTEVLQQYVHTYGPIPTSMFADQTAGRMDGTYDGSCTLAYASRGTTNHAVMIVGWSNDLPPICGSDSPDRAAGWIVRNSWGEGWGDDGYFYMAYGTGDVGRNSTFGYTWEDYDAADHVLYYDDDGWSTTWGYSDLDAWGMVAHTPPADTAATAVEFWTTDANSTVDITLYDDFDGSSTLSSQLAAMSDITYTEAGFHSVPLDPPIMLTAGDTVYTAIYFTNSVYTYTLAADSHGDPEPGHTWISNSGAGWYDLSTGQGSDVAIRLRTTHPNGGAYALQGEQCGYDTTYDTVACPLYDDGTGGDTFAGDHIHSRAHTVDSVLADHDAYGFYRLDGDKTLPSTGGQPATSSMSFDSTGSCPVYLMAQGNPYGITAPDCDAYAHVTCDPGGSRFAPVTFIGNEDFADSTETLIEAGTTLDLQVEIFAAGLTDAGDATEGNAVNVGMEVRTWDGAAQAWSAWQPYATAFSFEADEGANWRYALTNITLAEGIHELRGTYIDWAGNTGTTGANTKTVFVSNATTTPHAISTDGDLADWRANERHDGRDGAQAYVTWDDRFIYAGWSGGSSTDRCVAGFDLNVGTEDPTAAYDGATFPATGQPDYLLDYDKQTGTVQVFERSGSGWTSVAAGEIQTGQGGGGTICEARVPRALFDGNLGPDADLGIVMYQSNAAGDAVSGAFPATGNSSGSSPQTLNAQYHWPGTGAGIAPQAPDEGGRSEYATAAVAGATGGTYALGDTGATMAFSSVDNAPDSACTLEARVYEGHSHSGDTDALRRIYALGSDDCTGFSGDLTLSYTEGELNGNEETALQVYRWTGSAWQLYAVSEGDRDTAANELTAHGVSGFSDWILSDGTPTSVMLTDIKAEYNGAAVILTWKTGLVTNVVGFNLYRAESPDGLRTKLNATLIPAQGSGDPLGTTYTWTDPNLQAGTAYWYTLESINTDAGASLYAPVSIRIPRSRFFLFLPFIQR